MPTVFITGVKNTGFCIAEKFASEGFDVAISTRKLSDVEPLAEMLAKKYNIKARGYSLEMSDVDDIKRVFSCIKEDFGSLDTFVAITAGLIVFPACFTYNNGGGLEVGNANAGFLFTTLSSIFNQMPGGRIVGALFFLFMMFAAFSTVIAVFENIVSFWLELTNLKRWTICLINIGIMMVLVLPAIFSNSIWADIKLFGLGFMDLEDTIVSKWLLPLGSLVYVLFCTTRYGWGAKNFLTEVNTGKGAKFPKFMIPYMKYVLPVIIIAIFVVSAF